MGTTLGTLAAVATIAMGALGFQAATQDPAAPPSSKRVSANMTNASMDDVLDWLRRTGINFVIESGSPAADARLSLNINNQPLDKVMDAIASALGGEWVKHGDVYTLRSHRFFAPGAPAFGLDEHELRAWSEEFAPKIQEHLRELAPQIEKFRMEIPKLEELRELQGLKGFEDLKDLELMPEFREFKFEMPDMSSIKELMQGLTDKQKELLKSRGHLVPEDLTAKQRDLLKKLGGLDGKIRLHQDGEDLTIIGPHGDDVILAPRPERLLPGTPAPEIAIAPKVANWKELNSSLSAEQRGLLKTQGWLYPDQLTSEQRKLITLPEGSTFTITVSDGKDSITIKSRN